MKTTCFLANYTCTEQQCNSCIGGGSRGDRVCTNYKCWDEYFTISYSISNRIEAETVHIVESFLNYIPFPYNE